MKRKRTMSTIQPPLTSAEKATFAGIVGLGFSLVFVIVFILIVLQ